MSLHRQSLASHSSSVSASCHCLSDSLCWWNLTSLSSSDSVPHLCLALSIHRHFQHWHAGYNRFKGGTCILHKIVYSSGQKSSCFVFILQLYYSSIFCILFPFWDCASHVMGAVWSDNCSSIVLSCGLIQLKWQCCSMLIRNRGLLNL